MPSADRHLGELELLERATTPGLAPDPHAASCPTCRDRIEGLAAGREHLADLAALATEAESGPRVPVPTALSRLSRTLARAEELVRAAERDDAALSAWLDGASARPDFPDVALHALQIASRLTSRRPSVALAFARSVRERLKGDGGGDRTLLAAEIDLLESQAFVYVGRIDEACELALAASSAIEAADAPGLLRARAAYYAGSALWGAGRSEAALSRLLAAREAFAADGQDPWVGRAEGAIGLVHFSEARFREALHAFDAALERLDPDVDPGPWEAIQQNRAGILMNLGRLSEARSAFGQALELAVRHGLSAAATTVRVNLLNLGLEEGAWEDVRVRGRKLVAFCDREGLSVDAYYARLALAEAQAALGSYGEVRGLVEAIRRDAPPEVRDDPDATLLLDRLDAGDNEMAGRLRRLRHYLSGRDRFEAAKRA
ncbi:MAG: tetratricopeptide repeat protein [Thermoanaerobaculia bacterium]